MLHPQMRHPATGVPGVTVQSGAAVLLSAACLALASEPAVSQQFTSDNQWVAPHGVATVVATVGQEYSLLQLVAALLPETEFNLGITYYREDQEERSEGHSVGSFYVKRRLVENDAGTGGWAVMGGTGVDRGHLEAGEVTDTFRSWWANGVYTVPFHDGAVTWDLLPGFLVNFDRDRSGETAWGMTYASRVAVYKVIPQSAIVGEVYGTTGEAYAKPKYRVGLRWESPRIVVAATYGDSFDREGSPRFEIGMMLFTNRLKWLCLGGCS